MKITDLRYDGAEIVVSFDVELSPDHLKLIGREFDESCKDGKLVIPGKHAATLVQSHGQSPVYFHNITVSLEAAHNELIQKADIAERQRIRFESALRDRAGLSETGGHE